MSHKKRKGGGEGREEGGEEIFGIRIDTPAFMDPSSHFFFSFLLQKVQVINGGMRTLFKGKVFSSSLPPPHHPSN